jgi:hypothetical protein
MVADLQVHDRVFMIFVTRRNIIMRPLRDAALASAALLSGCV